MSLRLCGWCRTEKPVTSFYAVSKKAGNLRGHCKSCMREIKRAQRDPAWRPSCIACGNRLERRSTGGRRMCPPCLLKKYSPEDFRPNGGRRLALKPCKGCGGPKERFFKASRYCMKCRKVWVGRKSLEEVKSNSTWGRVSRAKSMWQKYGITESQYDAMLAMGDGGCWICVNPPRKKRLAVEHDHGPSKRVRGLACMRCNKYRIGVNTPASAQKVLVYLTSTFDGRDLVV
jgi:hypothetical protein